MKLVAGLFTRSGIPIRAALHGLVALPLLAFATSLAMDTYLQYQSNMDAAYQTAATLSSMSSRQTEELLVQIRGSLQQLSERERIKSLDPDNCDPVLSDMPLFQPIIANVYTINADGNFVCSARAMPDGGLHAPLAQQVIQSSDQSRDFIIGGVERGRIVDGWVLALVHMIRDDDGRYIGLIGAAVDLQNFKPLIARDQNIPSTTLGIIDSDGVILAAGTEDIEQRIGARISEQNARLMASQKEGTYSGASFTGEPIIFSFTEVPNTGWRVIVSISESVVVAPLVRQAWYRLFLILATVCAMIAVTAKVARRIAMPVEEISDTVARIRAGATDTRARSYGPTEVRQIASELNDMLEARVLAEKSVRQSEERFRTAFQSSPDAMAITTLEDGRFLEVNDSYTPITGWSVAEVKDKTVNDIGVWNDLEGRQRFVQTLRQFGACKNVEEEFRTKDGKLFTGLISAHLITLNGVVCVLSVIRDVTAQKAAEERIHQLSFSDSLTGLPNRRLLLDRLGQAIFANNRHVRHGALLFVNLDNFKSFNETLGHDRGDLLLQEVAVRLKSCVEESDTVARIGGDEFSIILEELSGNAQDAASEAEETCEKILAAISQPYIVHAASVQFSCCIGITLFGKQEEEAIAPLKRAELAMYQSKSAGPNSMRFFDPQMQAIVSARTAMDQALRKAINEGQMHVHYQPQTTDDGCITGVEALARWNDPLRGMVSPAEFIPLAEATGLIVPLGEYVLDVVCRQLKQWSSHSEFSELTIAVNVSARQFHEVDFVEKIQSVLQRSGASPQRLVLEVTESLLLANIDDVIAKMNALKGLGIGFSLDDFGTGYSSLSYLKKLPLDELKIDRGFIRDILIDPNDAAIAKMVVALASSMGLSVIAEGVETEAQRALLSSIDCHHYQGYLFGRPMPIDELEAFLRRA